MLMVYKFLRDGAKSTAPQKTVEVEKSSSSSSAEKDSTNTGTNEKRNSFPKLSRKRSKSFGYPETTENFVLIDRVESKDDLTLLPKKTSDVLPETNALEQVKNLTDETSELYKSGVTHRSAPALNRVSSSPSKEEGPQQQLKRAL